MKKPDLIDRLYKILYETPIEEKEADELLKLAGIDTDAAYERLKKKIENIEKKQENKNEIDQSL